MVAELMTEVTVELMIEVQPEQVTELKTEQITKRAALTAVLLAEL